MTGTTYLISDTHFCHAGILNFMRRDGVTPVRDFSSVEEMDEAMVDNWNSIVRAQDKVYHLGDVAINKRGLESVKRLNGKKRLVRGNHDIFKTKEYAEAGFKEIYGVRVLEDLILSHIPLHPDSITKWANVHGHLHTDRVTLNSSVSVYPVIDPRYFNVSVEQINYTPISLDEVRERIREQQS